MFATTTTRIAGPFRLRDMTYERGAAQARHAHDEFQISLILRGRMEETTSQGGHVAVPGQVIVKAPGTHHANSFGPEGVRILCLDGDAGADPLLAEALREAAYFPDHGGPVSAAALDLLGAHRRSDDLEEPIAELIASLPPAFRGLRDDCLARRAAKIVRERFAAPISLSDVARELGVHRTHLARQFRLTFGQTLGGYLRRCRLERAAEMIASTGLPLADIALQCGFADQPHLTRIMTGSLRLSPRALRTLLDA